MGVWNVECVKIDGEIMAAVKMQDDWTGHTTLHLRKLHLDGNQYYVNVQKVRINVTDCRDRLIDYEGRCRTALDWYNKTKF